MNKTFLAIAALAMAALLAVAGCGGGNDNGYSGSESGEGGGSTSGRAYGGGGETSKSSETGAAAAVSLGSAAGAGKVLVDSNGMTLYYFEKDKKGNGKSTCYGACAEAWPPATTSGEAKATGGAAASMLGTLERSDGTTQVTYAGWPLYTFVGDKKPGEDNGTDSHAFGASWYPLHGNGEKAGE